MWNPQQLEDQSEEDNVDHDIKYYAGELKRKEFFHKNSFILCFIDFAKCSRKSYCFVFNSQFMQDMCKCIGLTVHVSKASPDSWSNSSNKSKHSLKVAGKCEQKGRRDLKVYFMQERVLSPGVWYTIQDETIRMPASC